MLVEVLLLVLFFFLILSLLGLLFLVARYCLPSFCPPSSNCPFVWLLTFISAALLLLELQVIAVHALY